MPPLTFPLFYGYITGQHFNYMHRFHSTILMMEGILRYFFCVPCLPPNTSKERGWRLLFLRLPLCNRIAEVKKLIMG